LREGRFSSIYRRIASADFSTAARISACEAEFQVCTAECPLLTRLAAQVVHQDFISADF
jgi:hypothetical protein